MTAEPVRQIALPEHARALSTFAAVDYEDAFVVGIGPVEARPAEEWARAIFEDAPASLRRSLWVGWQALGLRLAPPGSGQSVLGWKVRASADDYVVLGARSRIGMPAELIVQREAGALVFATLVRHQNLVARTLWKAVEPSHLIVARRVLEAASRRIVGRAAGGR